MLVIARQPDLRHKYFSPLHLVTKCINTCVGVGLGPHQQNATWLCVGLVAIVVGLGPLLVDPPLDSTDENADNKSKPSKELHRGNSALDDDETLLVVEQRNNDGGAKSEPPSATPSVTQPGATLSFKVAIAMLFFYYFAYAGAEHTPGTAGYND